MAVILVVPVEPIGAADGLEEIVVAQLVIEVDVGAARRVKASQELAHHDQQFKVGRLIDEAPLSLVLVVLRGLAVFQNVLRVGIELVPFVAVRWLQGNRGGVRLVGRNDAAEFPERRILKQAEVMARIVDRGRYEDGGATVVIQARLESEVLDDAGNDALLAFARAHQLLHRCPALAQDGALEVVQAPCLLVKPSVDGRLRDEPLWHITSLVFQIEDHFVRHTFVEFVSVDVGAKYIASGLFVLPQQRRAGEANKDRVLQPAFHLLVHAATLSAVAFVNEDVEASMNRWWRACKVGTVNLVE